MKPLFPPILALGVAVVLGCTVEGGSSETPASPAAEPAAAHHEAEPDPPVSPQLAKLNTNLPAKGSALPAFAGLTPTGDAVDNGTLKGRTTLINLWFYH